MTVPLIAVYGDADYLVETAGEFEDMGWKMRPVWTTPEDNWMFEERTVCWGALKGSDQAVAALTAATRGAGIVALVSTLTDDVANEFIEDLRHIGPIEMREQQTDKRMGLGKEHQKLLELLAGGISIGQAADELFISRRTAERRISQIRIALKVKTTAEALIAARTNPWPSSPKQ